MNLIHLYSAYNVDRQLWVLQVFLSTWNFVRNLFFDFNEPIITNTVSTEIVDRIVSTEDNTALSTQAILYPNPAGSKLNLRTTNGIQLQEIAIYNLQGQKMKDIYLVDTTINVENLASGMYLLKIETNLGIINKSFIKM